MNGKFVVLVEHQSTINENMLLRFLIYIAKLFMAEEKVLARFSFCLFITMLLRYESLYKILLHIIFIF